MDDPTTVYETAGGSRPSAAGTTSTSSPTPSAPTDWRGNNNIAESIFEQMAMERHPVPAWVVVGAGTGGTSATIGRLRAVPAAARPRLCVVDPENSAFFASWAARSDRVHRLEPRGSRASAGQRVEPVVHAGCHRRMIQVPDAASIAAMRLVHEVTGRSVGGSTGTNVWGALRLIVAEMLAAACPAAS